MELTIKTQWDLEAEQLLDSAIEAKLRLTFEQRIDAHENARELMMDLRKAGEQLRGKPQSAT